MVINSTQRKRTLSILLRYYGAQVLSSSKEANLVIGNSPPEDYSGQFMTFETLYELYPQFRF